MNEEQKKSLETRMVLRFEVNDIGSPVVEKEISDALMAIQGVCDVSIQHRAITNPVRQRTDSRRRGGSSKITSPESFPQSDVIHITYDPLQTNEAHLKDAVAKIGQRPTATEADLETPHPDLPHGASKESPPG